MLPLWVTWVQSLVGELRFPEPHRTVKKKKKQDRGYPELRGGGMGELLFNGCRVSIWDDEKF